MLAEGTKGKAIHKKGINAAATHSQRLQRGLRKPNEARRNSVGRRGCTWSGSIRNSHRTVCHTEGQQKVIPCRSAAKPFRSQHQCGMQSRNHYQKECPTYRVCLSVTPTEIDFEEHYKSSEIGAAGAQDLDFYDFGRSCVVSVCSCFWERAKVCRKWTPGRPRQVKRRWEEPQRYSAVPPPLGLVIYKIYLIYNQARGGG